METLFLKHQPEFLLLLRVDVQTLQLQLNMDTVVVMGGSLYIYVGPQIKVGLASYICC